MSEPMLSIYRSHDRELLFHGNLAECEARGIRIKRDLSSLTLDGQRLVIVNRGGFIAGSAAFWVVAP
jgi:hypothetical protein